MPPPCPPTPAPTHPRGLPHRRSPFIAAAPLAFSLSVYLPICRGDLDLPDVLLLGATSRRMAAGGEDSLVRPREPGSSANLKQGMTNALIRGSGQARRGREGEERVANVVFLSFFLKVRVLQPFESSCKRATLESVTSQVWPRPFSQPGRSVPAAALSFGPRQWPCDGGVRERLGE